MSPDPTRRRRNLNEDRNIGAKDEENIPNPSKNRDWEENRRTNNPSSPPVVESTLDPTKDSDVRDKRRSTEAKNTGPLTSPTSEPTPKRRDWNENRRTIEAKNNPQSPPVEESTPNPPRRREWNRNRTADVKNNPTSPVEEPTITKKKGFILGNDNNENSSSDRDLSNGEGSDRLRSRYNSGNSTKSAESSHSSDGSEKQMSRQDSNISNRVKVRNKWNRFAENSQTNTAGREPPPWRRGK